ncbi:hypothetical protein AMECASPLE_006339 [Ameca splendens]|uniref:Uncharacterized protein n=1 Tax=Ameca splendens TaxID=208324 RepID=A0ABV0YAE8_9TELE
MAPDNDVRLTGESGAVRQGGVQSLECVWTQPGYVHSSWNGGAERKRWDGGQGSLSRMVSPEGFLAGTIQDSGVCSQRVSVVLVRSSPVGSQHLKVAGQGEISTRVPTKTSLFSQVIINNQNGQEAVPQGQPLLFILPSRMLNELHLSLSSSSRQPHLVVKKS